MILSKEVLDILACPQCKGGITILADNAGLFCVTCCLKYPLRDGIPVMLVDEAEKICKG